jgi:hypothetical protein
MNFMRLMLFYTVLASANLQAYCHVKDSPNEQSDILYQLLKSSPGCPTDVVALKEIFEKEGLQALPSMVANRGHHNPSLGSFSIFESVEGHSSTLKMFVRPEHLYFGHFTSLSETREVILDQENTHNKLLIEAIAYDFKKGLFNFYELIGSISEQPQWFYRGDSLDALEDNKHLKISSNPQFGKKMRCSACHNSGGPIMKELEFPHNDWWTKKKGLPLGPNMASPPLKKYLTQFIDASDFSKNVQRGMKLLERNSNHNSRSLKEKLRPLFCTTEINLVSDTLPLSSPLNVIHVSSEIFINPLLQSAISLKMRKDFYIEALQKINSNFPETNLLDADHAFLAPVKSRINQLQVKNLIVSRVIDLEFTLDVLSIDYQNPLFSQKRCGLLKFLPDERNWFDLFKKNLNSAHSPSALELAKKLEIIDGPAHQKEAYNYLVRKQKGWTEQDPVLKEIILLNKLRLSVSKDDISKNPRGQIIEPGFRVVFPVFDVHSMPGHSFSTSLKPSNKPCSIFE